MSLLLAAGGVAPPPEAPIVGVLEEVAAEVGESTLWLQGPLFEEASSGGLTLDAEYLEEESQDWLTDVASLLQEADAFVESVVATELELPAEEEDWLSPGVPEAVAAVEVDGGWRPKKRQHQEVFSDTEDLAVILQAFRRIRSR